MMKDYYQKFMRALQLAGMSQRTQECYTRSVRMLVDFYNNPPDQITEAQLQDYFLHRRNTNKWSAATINMPALRRQAQISLFGPALLRRQAQIPLFGTAFYDGPGRLRIKEDLRLFYFHQSAV